MDQKGKRMAVLVGCNYPDTPYELHGCINDVLAMKQMLLERFGFDPNHVKMLTDESSSATMKPTGANIKKALAEMANNSESGDVLFFHFSGHGSSDLQLISQHGRPPYYEAIVPSDFNLITDKDFRELLNQVAKGATFIVLSDSSVSGDLIEQQIKPLGPTRPVPTPTQSTIKHKSISFESLLRHVEPPTVGNTFDIGDHMSRLFGRNASSRFRAPPVEVTRRENERILLSGCNLSETSADVSPGGRGKAYGAFTNAIETVLKGTSSPVELTYRELVVMARNVLRENGIEQHPCLYCSHRNADAIVLSHI